MTLDSGLLQILFSGLGTGAIYGLIAVGFNIVFKSTGALNFTQGEWVMTGGLLAALAFQTSHIPVWLACLLGTLVVGLVGLLSDRLVIRPMRNRSALTITLVSVGLALATRSLVMLSIGKNPQGMPGLSGDQLVTVLGATVPGQTFWILALTLVLMLATHWFFNRTVLGTAMRAAAANPDAAALVGISNRKVVSISFMLAAAMGGIAGTIITPLTLMSYDSGAMLGFKGFSAAMLGGLGSLYGAAVGGLLLGVLEAMVGGYVTSQFKDAAAFFMLLTILVLRPQGLLGSPNITKV
jgi:branched-chain amino acid transport system permease protein